MCTFCPTRYVLGLPVQCYFAPNILHFILDDGSNANADDDAAANDDAATNDDDAAKTKEEEKEREKGERGRGKVSLL